MKKIKKYELVYIKFTWAFILIGFVYFVFFNIIDNKPLGGYLNIFVNILFLATVSILNFTKYWLFQRQLFEINRFYVASRLGELFAIAFAIVFTGAGEWAYIIILFPILITTLCKGSRLGLTLVAYSFGIHMLLLVTQRSFRPGVLHDIITYILSDKFFYLIFLYIIMALFALLCGVINSDNIESEQENKRLLGQLEEKYEQLAVAQEEIKFNYEKIKDTNIKLEDTNKKLTSSIAEFYTLQQISKAISSIFDIKELLKYVNDIIIGVMGVNSSTIILYDEKKKRLKVHTTSISNREELIVLNDNINCPILLDALNDGKPIIENSVDPEKHVFAQGREVNSLISVPLNTKTRKFGLVLIEHKYCNAFDEENVRLLDIIGQQVGITMENAELYQQMQEMATVDGLTGVYNRLYFQDRLQKEMKSAEDGNYELSLAMFDIDHFKKFNDTFGHLFGDKVLKSIAELVRVSVRSSDVVARYGGEEFIILLPRTTLKEAYEKIENLREKISRTDVKDSLVTASVTVSFGISCYPGCSSSSHELLGTADTALYEAKATGRNRTRIVKEE